MSTLPTPSRPALLYAAVALPMAIDCLFTLAGQSHAYWHGQFSAVNEASPSGRVLLLAHPLAFAAAFLPYIALALLLVRHLRPPWNLAAGIAFVLGHAWGSTSWVPRLWTLIGLPHFAYWPWWVSIGYLVLLAVVLALCISAAFDAPSANARPGEP